MATHPDPIRVNILAQLGSNKGKSRQEGAKQLSTLLAEGRPNKIRDVLIQKNFSHGIPVALIEAVVAEKDSKGKGSKEVDDKHEMKKESLRTKRMQTFTQPLRAVINYVSPVMGPSSVSCIFKALLAAIMHGRLLPEDVACDLLHIATDLLQRRPHVESMQHTEWTKFVRLCFNVLLGDSLSIPLSPPLANESLSDEEHEVSDDAMEVDSPAPTRKRRRVEDKQKPASSKVVTRTPVVPSALDVACKNILVILLRSNTSPLVDSESRDLPSAIMSRCLRLLRKYSQTSTIVDAFIPALSVVISHYTLNQQKEIRKFTRDAWFPLLEVWKNTKSSSTKEFLVIILQRLLPFLTSETKCLVEDTPKYHEHLLDLQDVLGNWKPILSLESLRLEITSGAGTRQPFVAETFRYGWNFSSQHASTWAAFELRAECLVKLHLLFESPTGYNANASEKRKKMEDPILTLLSFDTTGKPEDRLRPIQCLLFVIDKHWHTLHPSLQQRVAGDLLKLLQRDDLRREDDLQSWILVCSASIAHACRAANSAPPFPSEEGKPWERLWTQAMHRSQHPKLCRAACHVAHALLRTDTLLSSPTIFIGIEGLARDIIVQGPSFPYDSVCMFLSLCIRVASQDVRLFRMQLGDKVLTWFLDTWRPTRQQPQTGIPPYNISDILAMLMTVCGFGDPVELLCEVPLPEGPTVSAALEDRDTAELRQFTLGARLPSFPRQSNASSSAVRGAASSRHISIGVAASTEPGINQKRISAFFSEHLETFLQDHEAHNFGGKAARLRAALDLAVLALSFESATAPAPSTPAIASQKAWKLIPKALSCLVSRKEWPEKALVLSAIDPLHLAEPREDLSHSFDVILPPGRGSGIRTDVLHSLTAEDRPRMVAARRDLQRKIFKFTENTLPQVLEQLDALIDLATQVEEGADVTMADDTFSSPTADDARKNPRIFAYIVRVCVDSTVAFQVLQSPSGEPVRGDRFVAILDDADDTSLAPFASAIVANAERQMISLNAQRLLEVFRTFEELIDSYDYKYNEQLQVLTITLLRSTVRTWYRLASESIVQEGAARLCQRILAVRRWSWSVRDQLVQFLCYYLSLNPPEKSWPPVPPNVDKQLWVEQEETAARLRSFLGDPDTRVRLRAASANARSFNFADIDERPALERYGEMRMHICNDLARLDEMLTRLLFLGNVLVVCSAVRRGAYWHLIETSLYMKMYDDHVEAILISAAERLGLPSISTLFEIYASQIATSLCRSDKEFVNISPSLLGYGGRRAECFSVALRAFTPSYLLANSPNVDGTSRGPMLFEGHRRVVDKTVEDALEDCFPEIVGHLMLIEAYDYTSNVEEGLEGLSEALERQLGPLSGYMNLRDGLSQHSDSVVAVVLISLNDGNISHGSEFLENLGVSHDAVSQVFRSLSRYRTDSFPSDEANLPSFSVVTVLAALEWALSCISESDTEAVTYHVLRHLVAQLEQSLLLNEQLRLLNVLSFWVSYRYRHFQPLDDGSKTPQPLRLTLLKTLINCTINIMHQQDLARGAQSILDWAFCQVETLPDMEGLADAVLRVGCIAHDFWKEGWEGTAKMGEEILEWIERVAVKLFRAGKKGISSRIISAVSAWPRIPTGQLNQISERAGPEQLSDMLEDTNISSNKFRLVRRLHKLASQDASNGDDDANTERASSRVKQFAKSDFWKLKSCIPTSERLLADDVQAFANMLFLHGGHIDGLDSANVQDPSVRGYHILPKGLGATDNPNVLPRRAIVIALLAILRGPSASQARLAFHCMRALVAVAPNDFKNLGTSLQAELDLLCAHPHCLTTSPTKGGLEELLKTEVEENLTADYPLWICRFTQTLCNVLSLHEPFYGPLALIVCEDAAFAEQVCPVLVFALLNGEQPKDASKNLSDYFKYILTSESTPIPCHRVIVDTVLHLRNFNPPNTSDPLASEQWLNVDYVLLSKSAIACGAYTTALLFSELAANSGSERGELESILYEIYGHIDEPDGFYGIKTTDQHQFLVKRFQHEEQWSKAFQFHGAAFESSGSDTNATMGVVQALHAFGFDRFAMSTLQNTLRSDDLNSSSMTYHLGWRTETWDLPHLHGDKASGKSLYLALRAVHRERNPAIIEEVVSSAMMEEIDRLRALGNENIAEIRQTSQALLCLNAIREYQSWDPARTTAEIENAQGLQRETDMRFADVEALAATRMSLLHAFNTRKLDTPAQIETRRGSDQKSLDAEIKCLLQLSESARNANVPQVALNSVVHARKLASGSRFDVSLEFARVLWKIGEPRPAMQFLETFCAPAAISVLDPKGFGTEEVDDLTAASVYALMGTWAFEASLTKPSTINSEYFARAVKLFRTNKFSPGTQREIGRQRAAIYHSYALFAEHQYTTVVKSPDSLRAKLLVDRKTQEIDERSQEIDRMKKSKMPNDAIEPLIKENSKARKLLGQDSLLFEEHNATRKTFLKLAVQMYSHTLTVSDIYDDDAPIRLCSLWLANPQDDFQKAIRPYLNSIPSHKFVFLAHQLTARACKPATSSTNDASAEQQTLSSIVLKMCKEHPYHCLLPLYCLGPSSRQSIKTSRTTSSSQSQSSHSSAPIENLSANRLWDALLGAEAKYSNRVRNVQRACDGCLEWAEFPIKDQVDYPHEIKEKAKRRKKLPTDSDGKYFLPKTLQKLPQLRNIKVPIITAHVPLDKTGKYDDFVHIQSYDNVFAVAGGLSRPKIIYCTGSDGKRYKQLFKGEGNDDLRQDAVMEQVFALMNKCLHRDREAKKRKLRVRDYKVVPLAAQAGVLEFVSHTEPLDNCLKGAHIRYTPENPSLGSDIACALKECRESCNKKRCSPQQRNKALTDLFLEYRSRFPPVMRHFFTERYKLPSVWFSARLNYSRSAATTSMVGHVLGLGDRHLQNILIDDKGELVHIDLGISFEQGKLLPVPEAVPFRLTADMVDGLGTSGTQGVFQRCAEETLRVLRDNSGTIMTVLEVFKHDPLYSWIPSKERKERAQPAGPISEYADAAFRLAGIDLPSGLVEEAADRSLNTVNRKLTKGVSIEFTVNELIAEATDPANLADMFIGWSPQY